MTPRLAVTREQVDRWDELYDGAPAERPPRELRLRLPERPTMPCPECGGYATDRWRCDGVEIDVVCDYCNGQSVVPIPEGTRVDVGWWALDGIVYHWSWHRVAFATLAEVVDTPLDIVTENIGQHWKVTLSHIEPAGEDQ